MNKKIAIFRYKEMNLKSRNEAKAYAENIPAFLVNRPNKFLKHCLPRMFPAIEKIPKENIVFSNKDNCTVKSTNSDILHDISFVNMKPFCSCKDFCKSHWPCKHLLSIFVEYPNYSWDSLNREYNGQACFNLDMLGDTQILTDCKEEHGLPMQETVQTESVHNIRKQCLTDVNAGNSTDRVCTYYKKTVSD